MSLSLRGSNIGDQGARSLAAALGATRVLQHLDLGENSITVEGARSLAAAFHNNATLTKLDLRINRISAAKSKRGSRALYVLHKRARARYHIDVASLSRLSSS